MRRFLGVTILACSCLLGVLSPAAPAEAAPEIGLHAYSDGRAELVLDVPQAREFADALGRNHDAEYLKHLINQWLASLPPHVRSLQLVGRIAAAIAANFTKLSTWQMRAVAYNPSAEVVSFHLLRDIPVWAVAHEWTDGRLVKERSDPSVYVMLGGAKLGIPSAREFEAMGYAWSNIKVVPDGRLAIVPVMPKAGTLFRERSFETVYVIDTHPLVWWEGRKRWAMTYNAFVRGGYSWSDIKFVPNGSLGQIRYGGIMY